MKERYPIGLKNLRTDVIGHYVIIVRLSFLLLLAGCTLPHQQRYTDRIALPQLTEDTFITSDGETLPVSYWEAGQNSPRAVIVGLHGFNDYRTAFKWVGNYFAKQGITFYAYDQRGFGETSFPGIWPGSENIQSDLTEMIGLLREKYPSTPLYILGESMGGAVAAITLSKNPETTAMVNGVILSAPALWGGTEMNPLYQFTLWLAAHCFPSYKMTGSDLEVQASDNIEMLKALGEDPLVIKETRIDAIYGLVNLMGEAQESIAHVELPILFLYGAQDQIVPSHSIDTAVHKTRAPHKIITYPQGWHMLLRDLQRKNVWNDILAWILHPETKPDAAESSQEATANREDRQNM